LGKMMGIAAPEKSSNMIYFMTPSRAVAQASSPCVPQPVRKGKMSGAAGAAHSAGQSAKERSR